MVTDQKNCAKKFIVISTILGLLLMWQVLHADSHCGDSIFAEDLAGTCRAKPQPTMGALEVESSLPYLANLRLTEET